jgi:hypothetical protein
MKWTGWNFMHDLEALNLLGHERIPVFKSGLHMMTLRACPRVRLRKLPGDTFGDRLTKLVTNLEIRALNISVLT